MVTLPFSAKRATRWLLLVPGWSLLLLPSCWQLCSVALDCASARPQAFTLPPGLAAAPLSPVVQLPPGCLLFHILGKSHLGPEVERTSFQHQGLGCSPGTHWWSCHSTPDFLWLRGDCEEAAGCPDLCGCYQFL